MRIYVVRHGESENNLKSLWTGWYDAALTQKGREDAKKAGELLKGISFGKIYTSDLKRAMNTAEIALPGCAYETTYLLREIDVGSLTNMPLSTLTDEQKEKIPDCGYAEFGGETNEAFENRVCSFMKKLEESGEEAKAVFCHGGWMRKMLDIVMGMRIPRSRLYCGNCAVAVFEYAGGEWKLLSLINHI